MIDLQNHVVVVTGAASVLGSTLAKALASYGSAVALLDDNAAVNAVAEDINIAGGVAAAFVTSFNSQQETRAAFDSARQALGPCQVLIHALVPPDAAQTQAFMDIDVDQWIQASEVPVRAATYCFQAAFEQMQGGGGRIVLLCPTLCLSGAPLRVPYTTAVEAQRGLVKTAAKQWGGLNITVNCLALNLETLLVGDEPQPGTGAPGYDVAALPAAVDIERDIAPVVSFLSSTDSRFITATTLVADGGVWTAL